MLEQYRKGSLPSTELLAADDHLAACARCREVASRAEAVKKSFAALGAELRARAPEEMEHLSYELLTAFIRGGLDEVERETVESHLAFCVECDDDVRDLSAFAAEVSDRRGRPAREPAAPTLWDRLAAFWLPLWNRPALRVGFSTALVITFVGALLWGLFTGPNPRPQDEVARTSPPSPVDTRPAKPDPSPAPSASPPEPRNANVSRPPSSPTPTRPDAPHPTGSVPTTTASPSPAATLAAALDDRRGRVTLDRQGRIEGLPALPPDLRRAVVAALQTRRVQTPAPIRELVGNAGTLLSGAAEGDSFAVSAPVGTVVRSTRPTLTWQALGGASSYSVTIFDADFNAVAASPPLTATSWPLPQPLRRGGVYRWQVTARTAGAEVLAPSPAEPEARFKVLDENSLGALSRAEPACLESHLACGVLYSRMGLMDEAEREFKSLADANPRSALARALLRDVRRLRLPR